MHVALTINILMAAGTSNLANKKEDNLLVYYACFSLQSVTIYLVGRLRVKSSDTRVVLRACLLRVCYFQIAKM